MYILLNLFFLFVCYAGVGIETFLHVFRLLILLILTICCYKGFHTWIFQSSIFTYVHRSTVYFDSFVVLTWLLWQKSTLVYSGDFFLSLGKEPIKSSKRVISVASSCASVKTESLLLLPTDVGSFRWFRLWSLAGFLPSPDPTLPWVSWFRGLFSVTGPVSRNHPLKWQCDLERSTIHSALCPSPWIQWNISKYPHFCCRNGAREVMRLSNDAMFANLLSQSLHSWP